MVSVIEKTNRTTEKRCMKIYDPNNMEWFYGEIWVENGKVMVNELYRMED